jgi:hypothetical protein
MAEYQLTITKRELDPDFERKMSDHQQRYRHDAYNAPVPPSREMSVKTLEVTVDESTFAAIRKAALETL